MSNAAEDGENPKGWLLATAVAVTSSTIRLFSVCFPCNVGFKGCFGKTESFADRAWFDCEQFQAEYPYCYANPTPVSIEDQPANKQRTDNAVLEPSSSENPRLSLNEALNVDNFTSGAKVEPIKNGVATLPKSEIRKPPKPKRPKFRKHRSRSFKNNFFTANLEHDRIHGSRKDSFRAEGKTQSPPIRRPGPELFSNHVPSIRSPILQRKNIPPIEFDFVESFPWDDDSFESDDSEEFRVFQQNIFGDVWGPSELEDAFEGYNEFALRSFGFKSENHFLRGSPQRTSNEKFEDFFPTHFNKPSKPSEAITDSPSSENDNVSISDNLNNNNNINITKIDSEDIISKYSDIQSVDLSAKDVTDEDIKDFIKMSLLSQSDHLKDQSKDFMFQCDISLSYCGKSFKRDLLCDLVNQMISEYLVEYKSSVSFRSDYPVEIIQKKVLNQLKINKHFGSPTSYISKDIQAVRQTMLLSKKSFENQIDPDSIIIKKLVRNEISNEGKLWQNIDDEKNDVKLNISEEIFANLLTKELDAICDVLKNKEMSLRADI